MRIGFDISSQSLPRSGVGQYQINLINALLSMDKENFYNLYAFNFRSRHRFDDIKFPSENYKVNVIPVPQRLMTLWWMMSDFPSLEKVAGECDIYQISEICVQPVKKAKRVAFIHDLTTILYPEYHVKSNVFLHNRRFKDMHKIDAILTNSEHTKRDIAEYLKIKPEKIFVTRLGADDRFCPKGGAEISAVTEKYSINKPYILFVGTLEPRKNIISVIKAFDMLKSARKIPHTLVLAGQKGWKYEEIFKEIGSSEYRSDIMYIGYAHDNDIPALMGGAEVFVYPSFYEGFGLPVLEAMKCGAPVITSNLSSMPEVGGNACLYVDPNSTEDLADKLYSAISDTDTRLRLSKAGIERAKLFTWRNCANDTLKVYKM